ncbi:glycosyltransferase family 2 protein [Candidatus Nomurabacteria bacterium]|nr:glycosyltransferase family 2 protein [Candidatus Nomurabacteria bacterium]
MREGLKNFVIPQQGRAVQSVFEPSVSAIIPTFKPGVMAFRLVEDLLRYNPALNVVVVDDSTPLEHESHAVLARIAALPRTTLLRTPTNTLKAGALNVGVRHVLAQTHPPAVICTLDDDVVVFPHTLSVMVHALLADKGLGAVCSRVAVANKNKNVLTRLQGLEYLGYNAIRLADQGFFWGPLVMPGMLTAFRTRALKKVGLFSEGHLIEDYEITTRLKSQGWHVRAALDAPAWTSVPETLSQLWRQRTRWSLGGVRVVLDAKPIAVIQDVIGHGVFIATLATIGLLLLIKSSGAPSLLVHAIVALSLGQLLLWYGFQLWLMRLYPERDWKDWFLRVSVLPELIYSNIMTIALIGSYLFTLYSSVKAFVPVRMAHAVNVVFRAVGYEAQWGTRN